MGVPILAMVRQLPSRNEVGANALQIHVEPESVESEAFRTLRTTLSFSSEDMERIAITSSEPGDGKTTVLANLGASYAQVGKRTLIIDADLRRNGPQAQYWRPLCVGEPSHRERSEIFESGSVHAHHLQRLWDQDSCGHPCSYHLFRVRVRSTGTRWNSGLDGDDWSAPGWNYVDREQRLQSLIGTQ